MDGVIGIDDNQDGKGRGVVATWFVHRGDGPCSWTVSWMVHCAVWLLKVIGGPWERVGGFTAFHDARAGALSLGSLK